MQCCLLSICAPSLSLIPLQPSGFSLLPRVLELETLQLPSTTQYELDLLSVGGRESSGEPEWKNPFHFPSCLGPGVGRAEGGPFPGPLFPWESVPKDFCWYCE